MNATLTSFSMFAGGKRKAPALRKLRVGLGSVLLGRESPLPHAIGSGEEMDVSSFVLSYP